MDIRIIHSYQKLMDEGLAPKILCGNDKDHTEPLVRLSGDDIEFWCLACNWTWTPGKRAYESMKRIVELNWNLI